MNIPRGLAALAVVAACGVAALCQQQQPTGYHGVLCIKVNPGKDAEHNKWWDEEGRKLMRAMVDSGVLATYYRLRAVAPSGTLAPCDVVTVSVYPGLPPEPATPEQREALLKKAGITNAEEFQARGNATRTVVSSEIFQNQVALGTMKKGDYAAVSYMKTAHITDWLTMEKTIWQPLADAMIKEGVQSGWSVNLEIFPNGDDMPYQGVSVDVYPSLAAAIKGQNFDPRFDEWFKRVHPGLDENSTLDNALKTRTQSKVYLFQIEDVIEAAK
jgi:hypothetical protein